MRNALVNFKKKAVDNLRQVMGAGADLDVFDSITELNSSLGHGEVYDKALLWHTYPGDEDPKALAEYAEELEQLSYLLGKTAEAPEVWVMEKTREGCAYDFERLSNLGDLAIVHIASLGGIGPVLQSALGATISEIKVSRKLVGLYGEEEYNEDMQASMSDFGEADEFEDATEDDFAEADDSVTSDDFEDVTADDFEDASEDEFEDASGDEFEDATDDDFEDASDNDFENAVDDFESAVDDFESAGDEFESADDDFEDASEPAPTPVQIQAPAQTFVEEEDEFEGDSDDFEEADDTSVEPQAPYGDEDFSPAISDFGGDTQGTSVPMANDFEEEDEFEAKEVVDDVDDFEEAVEPESEFKEEETPAFTGNEDEFEAKEVVTDNIPPTQVVPEPQPQKKKLNLFGKKEKPVPAPVPVPVQTQNVVQQSGDDALVAAAENAELSKSALNVLKSVCAKRCCQITVTGERGVGKSTIAMNIGNVLAKHFRVLVVDMDGETRGESYMCDQVIQNIPPEDSGMRSIFSAGLNAGNKPFVVKKNLAISTLGLASDTFVTNEVFTANNVSRAHNQLMKDFDFIIYDMPLDAALDKLTGFITPSYILYCVEGSNYGFMNLLFRIGNLEDNAVAQQLVENAIVVPTKCTGYSYIGNIPVKNTKQALRAVQSIGNELVGGECELDFADMEFAATMPFNAQVQQVVGSKMFYSDTRSGFKEYSKLIASVFGL